MLGALDEDETLTPLGRHVAQLPMEPRLGKLLVTAAFMGCLSSALTIAACLSYKTPFQTAFQVRYWFQNRMALNVQQGKSSC